MKIRSTKLLLFFLLLCGQKLVANPPVWTVSANNFQFSMNLTAQVKLNTLPANGAGNLVGVFVGTELRGVASPQIAAGTARYFITIFSNLAAGETLTFKTYTAADDLVHPAAETLPFQRQTVVGNSANLFALTIYSDDDFPISLAEIPAQTASAGSSFLSTYLPEFLETVDGQPVAWSATGSANLTATIVSGTILSVTATNANWAGTETVTVTATETGTTNAYSASRTVSFTKNVAVPTPVFAAIPVQTACEEVPFADNNLSNYLTFPGGGCLEHSFKIITPTGTATAPTWVQPASAPGSMTLKMQAKYGGQDFTGAPGSLQLAAFRGNVLAGVATPILVGTDQFYFLTIGKVGEGAVTFKFYDGGKMFLHENTATAVFTPNGSGNMKLEFAPLDFSLSASTGAWSVDLVDQNWYGTAQVVFYSRSCSDPTKVDEVQTDFSRLHAADCQFFTYFADNDNDGFGNPATTTQHYTLPSGYAANNTDCDDTKASVNPGATEICNFIDDNCAAGVDEGKIYVNFSGTVLPTGCPQVASGKVNLSIAAAAAPVVYTWASGQTTQNLTNLGVGSYQVTVIGNDGCTSTQSFSVAASNNLAVSFSAINVTCFGSANGTIFSTPAGGTAPFTYLWSNGKNTKNINLLAAATYILTMTDAVGCTKTNSQTVMQPTAVNFTLGSLPNGANHNVTLTATGGSPIGAPTYTYNRSGTTVYQPGNVFMALPAATYIFKTKDANACIKSRIAKVPITTPGNGNKNAPDSNNFVWELNEEEAALSEDILLKMFEVKLAGAEMLAYPNPFSDQLTLVFPEITETEGTVVLFDALGRSVFQKNVVVEKEKLLELDIADLPRGTYLLSFLGKNGVAKKVKMTKM